MNCGCGSLLSYPLMRRCLEQMCEEGNSGREMSTRNAAGTISLYRVRRYGVCLCVSIIDHLTALIYACNAPIILCCEYNYVFDYVRPLQTGGRTPAAVQSW